MKNMNKIELTVPMLEQQKRADNIIVKFLGMDNMVQLFT